MTKPQTIHEVLSMLLAFQQGRAETLTVESIRAAIIADYEHQQSAKRSARMRDVWARRKAAVL